MASLKGRVTLVTGASRGVGRGIALGLGEAGATVYLTARTLRSGDGRGSLEATAREIAELGGEPRPFPCDHTRDEQVEALFRTLWDERGRLDVLVSSAWGGYERMVEGGEFTWTRPFWEQPRWRWDAMFGAGVRAAYVAGALAAERMVRARSGLIVNVSFWAARKHLANVPYGASKAATDKMTSDMAEELRPYGVAAVSLYPGLVRTEAVLAHADQLDLSGSESPQFVGRVVAALAADPDVVERSGQVLVAAELARRYGVLDLDGSQPRPLTLDDA